MAYPLKITNRPRLLSYVICFIESVVTRTGVVLYRICGQDATKLCYLLSTAFKVSTVPIVDSVHSLWRNYSSGAQHNMATSLCLPLSFLLLSPFFPHVSNLLGTCPDFFDGLGARRALEYRAPRARCDLDACISKIYALTNVVWVMQNQ